MDSRVPHYYYMYIYILFVFTGTDNVTPQPGNLFPPVCVGIKMGLSYCNSDVTAGYSNAICSDTSWSTVRLTALV